MKERTFTGADLRGYRTLRKRSSCLLSFPDGLVRHVTLTAWEWDVFDWVETRLRPYPHGILQDVLACAIDRTSGFALRRLQPPGWDRQLRVTFNDSAAHPRISPLLAAFRENADDITGQAARTFDAVLIAGLKWHLAMWTYERMGFSSLARANR